jgi:hypothetical protein
MIGGVTPFCLADLFTGPLPGAMFVTWDREARTAVHTRVFTISVRMGITAAAIGAAVAGRG